MSKKYLIVVLLAVALFTTGCGQKGEELCKDQAETFSADLEGVEKYEMYQQTFQGCMETVNY